MEVVGKIYTQILAGGFFLCHHSAPFSWRRTCVLKDETSFNPGNLCHE